MNFRVLLAGGVAPLALASHGVYAAEAPATTTAAAAPVTTAPSTKPAATPSAAPTTTAPTAGNAAVKPAPQPASQPAVKADLSGKRFIVIAVDENFNEVSGCSIDASVNLIKQFEQNYAVRDKQDVLAMCALQFASQVEQKQIDNTNDALETIERIKRLNLLLDQYLEN